MADVFNQTKSQEKGKFIFLSAEPSILPIPSLVKYYNMKMEAEAYLEQSCPQLDIIVFRPGLVTDFEKRPLTVPIGFLADFASNVASSGLMPFHS